MSAVLGDEYDLGGWGEIAAALDVSPRRAQQYESEGRIRVHRPRGDGACVYARLAELREDVASWAPRMVASRPRLAVAM